MKKIEEAIREEKKQKGEITDGNKETAAVAVYKKMQKSESSPDLSSLDDSGKGKNTLKRSKSTGDLRSEKKGNFPSDNDSSP